MAWLIEKRRKPRKAAKADRRGGAILREAFAPKPERKTPSLLRGVRHVDVAAAYSRIHDRFRKIPGRLQAYSGARTRMV
jgi:hypothetical protein